MPFELHPEYPPEGISRSELEGRYGERFPDHVRSFVQDAGLPYAPAPVVPNSMRSLQLAEAGREAGVLDRLHPLLFRAYWAEGRDIGDVEVLGDVARRAGLDVDDALTAVTAGRYEERVRRSTEVAIDLGIGGVPAWVIDDRVLVPGAQPHAVFERVLHRLGIEPLSDEPPADEQRSDGGHAGPLAGPD